MMEVADWSFQKGLEYIFAARRNEDWRGDAVTERQLGALAQDYRLRGMTLIMTGVAADAEEDSADRPAGWAPPLGRRWDWPADCDDV